MTKRLTALAGWLTTTIAASAQTVTGYVIDNLGHPLPYVNVVALTLPDSAFVAGVTTGEDGRFALDTQGRGRLLRFSLVGYETRYALPADNLTRIEMAPLAQTLGELTVKGDLPRTRLKGEGMVTTVSGTLLEHAGTVERLLDRVPNVSARQGKIEVFGRGTPEIYINGRKMREDSELQRLNPEDIKDVEVITNPGARYDASVNAVIRIRTKKAAGEGLGVDNRLYAEVNDYGYLVGQDNLNLSYRRGGLDIATTLRAAKWATPDPKSLEQVTYLEETWRQRNQIDQVYKSENLYARLAVSYALGHDHSLGISASYSRRPWSQAGGYMTSALTRDESPTERLRSDYATATQATTLQGNAYYTGKMGEWTIDMNADWMYTKSASTMNTLEVYTPTGQAPEHNDVTTRDTPRSNLLAARLVVTAPLLGGTLSLGGEYSYTLRKSDYAIVPAGLIDDDRGRVEEGLATAFVEYARQLGPLQAQVGLRYEDVDFDYYEDGVHMPGQSRAYGDLFPSAALSATLGKLNLQLGYSADISRPSYHSLRANINYDNRYTYEGGNPLLLPSKSHNLNLAATWRWLTASLGFSHVTDPILSHTETYKDNPATALLTQVNGEAYDKAYASLSLRPTLGIWHPSLSLAVEKQWFKMETHGHNPLDNPMATLRLDNTLKTKLGEVSLLVRGNTPGATENAYVSKPALSADLSLYKSFMGDKLTLQLYVSDVFKSAKTNYNIYYGTLRDMTYHAPALRAVNLTLRYRLNATRGKYKGTGAGQAQKSRL